MKQKIKLTMATIVAVIGIIFLLHTPKVYAESYSAPPQEVTFGETYSEELYSNDVYRYDISLKKSGILTITGDLTSLSNSSNVSAYIYLYDEAGNRLNYYKIGEWFRITVNLGKGDYYITVNQCLDYVRYNIKPTFKEFPTTSVKKLTNLKGKNLKINWARKLTVDGYQVQVAANSKFTKKKKTYIITEPSTTSKIVSKLKKSRKYYVRIRTYTSTLDGIKAFSKWSNVKSIKIKK